MNTTTVYDLLMTAPDAQVTRCQIAFRAVADGRWSDAEFALRNAAKEEGRSDWAYRAEKMAAHCNDQAHQAKIRAQEDACAYHALSVRDNAIDRKWAARA